ncbi:efflux RND transporter permease subunit, partial [Acinetobacter baumannii]
GFSGKVERVLDRMTERYARSLDRVLGNWKPLALVVAVLLLAAGGLFTLLQTELVPPEDTGVVDVRLTAPEGTGYDQLDRWV